MAIGLRLARTRRYDHENNVVLEELLVIAAETALHLHESAGHTRFFVVYHTSSVADRVGAVHPDRPPKMKGG